MQAQYQYSLISGCLHTISPCTSFALYQYSTAGLRQSPAVSRPTLQTGDEINEAYERLTYNIPQRQPPQPASHILSRPPSSSGSTHTLRRTPKFEEQIAPRRRATSVATADRRNPDLNPQAAAPISVDHLPPPSSDDEDGSTTPRLTRTSPDPSNWPQRTTRISKRTASAILYALEEAIRTPFPFTPELAEENASMADLAFGGPSGRAQNGGSRSAAGPVPVSSTPATRAMTPTEVLRQRRDREAKKRAETEARQREEEEEILRLQEERRISAERRAVAAGIAAEPASKRASGGGRRSGVEQLSQETGERRRSDRVSTGSATRLNPPLGPQSAAPTSAGVRAQEPSGTTRLATDSGNLQPSAARNRAASTSQPQPRPVPPQTSRAASATFSSQQLPSQTRLTSAGAGTTQAQAGVSAAPSFQRAPPPQSTNTQSRTANTSSFPHAFERWEALSSQWEGLTSYWIRRLEGNSDELKGQPLNQQFARQVTDLSAAGANLFHAVVELQRLRASSERKFQRWFYETRSEQERAREKIAELEAALRAERQNHHETPAAVARVDADRLATERATAEEIKRNAEQMVKEMQRELQISRDEARRGWEEIGRMEQAERDRTTSLRNGEATLVGGVQVVPMQLGGTSRQASTNRASTRDGPLPGDTGGLHTLQDQSLDSPGIGYTNYDPARSETDTDPFTENGREATSQPLPRIPPLATTAAQSYQQSSSTSAAAAIQTARAAATTSHPTSPLRQTTAPALNPAATTGGTYLSYRPEGAIPPAATSGPFYQQQGTGTALLHEDVLQQRPRTTEGDERSYVQSVDETLSEEEYAYDGEGNVRRDAQGRPMIYRQASGSEDSDEYNVQGQLERERLYGAQYGSGVSGVEYGTGSTATAGGVGGGTSNGNGSGGYGGGGQAPAAYDGSGYGWDAVPRHHHPTRLSDVLEEDERSRTSPSRASERSRGLH
ncbi:hypothetical protein MMC27_006644 [Xylographa pallens]|nr:hypothetical protein [Xylographa pallens]